MKPPPLLPALTPEEWAQRRLVTTDDAQVRRLPSGLLLTLGTMRLLIRDAPDLFGVAALALDGTRDSEGREYGFPRAEIAALDRVTNTLSMDVERLIHLGYADSAHVVEHDRGALLTLSHRVKMLVSPRRSGWRSPPKR